MFYPKILILSLLYFAPFLALSGPPILSLSSGSELSQGIVKLEWNSSKSIEDDELTFELHQSLQSDFNSYKLIYEGVDKGSFLSGLNDGQYFYRVREQGGVWSTPVAVEVKHHPLKLALVLMGIGAFVFLSTIILVLKGSRSSKQKV